MRKTFVLLFVLACIPLISQALDLIYDIHPDFKSVDFEFQNMIDRVQPKVAMTTRNPVNKDQQAEGSLWFNQSNSKIFIRTDKAWIQLN